LDIAEIIIAYQAVEKNSGKTESGCKSAPIFVITGRLAGECCKKKNLATYYSGV